MNATEMSPPQLAPKIPNPADHSPPNRHLPDRIQPARLAALLQEGGRALLLDVRSPAEYDAQHVPGAVLQPLDTLNPAEWASKHSDVPLYLLCQSGGRASRAAALLTNQGVACCVVEGGLEAWTAAGLPVEKAASNVLPLMRQVQLVIGLVSGTGAALAIWKHPLFALIPLFTSAGLVFAGATGYCGLALLMARMPWNQRRAGDDGTRATPRAAASCCANPGDAQ